MKFSLLYTYLCLFIALGVTAQEKRSPVQARFYGEWIPQPYTPKYFHIYNKRSTLSLGNYQLFIYCRNEYVGDTLLLFVTRTDAVSGIPDKWLPENDLFARCYISGNMLYIRYVDKAYRYNAKEMDPPHKLVKRSSVLPKGFDAD